MTLANSSGVPTRPIGMSAPSCVTYCSRDRPEALRPPRDRKSTRLNSSHLGISYAVFCLKKKKKLAQCNGSPHMLQTQTAPRAQTQAHRLTYVLMLLLAAVGYSLLFYRPACFLSVLFFNDPATTALYTLSLHDALPNSSGVPTRPIGMSAPSCVTYCSRDRPEALRPP